MTIEEKIRNELKKVMDPELGVNIVDLGLIYGVGVNQKGLATITMTLTTPGCPMIPVFEIMIRKVVGKVEGVNEIKINLTFDPPWDPSKISPSVQKALGF